MENYEAIFKTFIEKYSQNGYSNSLCSSYYNLLAAATSFFSRKGVYITEESKLKEELGIDSLNMYEIACKIEERIHVDITNKLGEIVTVSDLRCLTYSENTLER